jgi:hypothetical protein
MTAAVALAEPQVTEDDDPLATMTDEAQECRLFRHIWKPYRAVPGATVEGRNRRSWFTIELYCARGCGTIKSQPMDAAGYTWPARYSYDGRFQVKGGVDRDLLAAIRRNRIQRLLNRSAEPLTREKAQQLTLAGS